MGQNSPAYGKRLPEHKDVQLLANIWMSVKKTILDTSPDFVMDLSV